MCLALVVAVGLVGCGQSLAKKPASATPTATIQPVATVQPVEELPTFSDWRAAYLSSDRHLHVVTLDGKTDVAGLMLPDLASPGLTFTTAGISPDGRMLAYNPLELDILDLSGKQQGVVQAQANAYGLFWSPDSSQIAVDEGNGTLAMASAQTGALRTIQGLPMHIVGPVLGWIDSMHLAITDLQDPGLVTLPNGDQYSTSTGVASLDVTTGKIRLIARISSAGMACERLTLSPDGKKLLFSNAACHGLPYTPLVDEINTATGAITPLPAIDRATGSGFTSVAWQKGADTVAVSTGFAVNGNLKTWVLDLARDSAYVLPDTGYVAGWAPGSSTLVLTDGQQIGIGGGPFTLTALAFGVNGQVMSSTVLTQAAMTFPFLGFVRTA